jgi:hypothetical protein
MGDFNDAVLPALGGFQGASLGSIEALASAMVVQAEGFSAALTEQAAALVAPVVNPNFPVVATAPVPGTAVQPPLINVTWNVPVQPTAFMGQIGNLSGLLPGPFTGIAPTLNFPVAPGPPPTDALLAQIEADLAAVIATGQGTFLPTQAQQALMDAAYEREYRTVANGLSELDRMESLGYMFPPASFIDARLKMQTELNNTMAGISRDIFATQMKTQLDNLMACRTLAVNVEKALIEIFTAEVEAYKAQVEAQGVLESVFKTQVEAYTAEVQAGVAAIGAQVSILKAQIDAYQAQLMGYDSAVKGMVGQAQAASEYNQAQAEVYRAAVAAITSFNDTVTKQWQAVINEQEQIAQVGVAAAKANGDLYIAARGLSIDATKVGAQVSAQVAAAALGAAHWSTSISASVSASNSTSSSESTSASV